MPEMETEEWFLSYITPACLFITALLGSLFFGSFPWSSCLGELGWCLLLQEGLSSQFVLNCICYLALDMESTCGHQSIFIRKMPPLVCITASAGLKSCVERTWALQGWNWQENVYQKLSCGAFLESNVKSAAHVHSACQLAEWVLQSRALGWCGSRGGWEAPGLTRSQQKTICFLPLVESNFPEQDFV